MKIFLREHIEFFIAGSIIVILLFNVRCFAQKQNERIIYEESASFKEAKHRKKVVSQMDAKTTKKQLDLEEDNPAITVFREKLIPYLEELLGIHLNDLSMNKSNNAEPESINKNELQKYPLKHDWKGIRQVEPGNNL